ncbi:MAG: hypothetical protein M0C28_30585 [Candidatus Moduliflexus flocculans]|nr:hypothetical protein [Candidatus Moduliflexus flocculans]
MPSTIFAGFYEGAVNLSGLQISTPAVNQFKDPFEQADPEIYLRYPAPAIPRRCRWSGRKVPQSLRLPSSSTKMDGKWINLVSIRLVPMHTANEMIWFHNDEVNGFPIVP